MKRRTNVVVAACAATALAVMGSAGFLSSALDAQAPDATAFEVASVKVNRSGDNRVMIANQPGGRFVASNVTVRMLLRAAFRVQDFQIVGGPSWLGSDRFDITAKASGDVTPERLAAMIQSLLTERFSLTTHHDMREMPIYALVMARTDGKTGPQLHASQVDCAGARGRGAPPAPPLSFADRPMCGTRVAPGNISGGAVSMPQLATSLSNWVNRTVVDRTGLQGNFDVDLQWTPDQMPPPPPGGAPAGAPPMPPIDPNGPSIFTAVQEQLGLKLDSQRGPVEVVVIDRAEHPTED